MRTKHVESIDIPEGVSCEIEGNSLTCKKENLEVTKTIQISSSVVKIDGNQIQIVSEKANKKIKSYMKTFAAHIRNLFKGLNENFVYELEICHVHFPMTVKVEGDKLSISNYLGEKEKRFAKILPDVKVDVKGNKITVSSHNLENAGQTAANIEKASKITNKDRRVFQDGIFMTNKNGRMI